MTVEPTPPVHIRVDPIVEPLEGAPVLPLWSYDPADIGCSVREFTMAGVARSFVSCGDGGDEGEEGVRVVGTAPYRTRIVAILPPAGRFNGSVIVEWLNVSGGLDVPVAWLMLHRELVRSGFAYVAVSAQKVGIDGGEAIGRGARMPLKVAAPARYGSLEHPGDGFSYDIFSDVARALRRPGAAGILGALEPRRIAAVGESQSAFFLATYVNAIDAASGLFDGFLIFSRSAIASGLDGTSLFDPPPGLLDTPVRLRADLRVPVMQVVTETDLIRLAGSLGFHAARQPDGDRLRTWEIAGTAHADNYVYRIGAIDTGAVALPALAAAWDPIGEFQGIVLDPPMNNAPQHHYVKQAALASLDRWMRTGEPPAKAPPIDLAPGDPPTLVTDGHGNATGGVRTPWLDVPTSRLTGVDGAPAMPMAGSVTPFDAERLRSLYTGGREDYLRRFADALDGAIAGGFLLAEDREEIVALAGARYPGD